MMRQRHVHVGPEQACAALDPPGDHVHRRIAEGQATAADAGR